MLFLVKFIINFYDFTEDVREKLSFFYYFPNYHNSRKSLKLPRNSSRRVLIKITTSRSFLSLKRENDFYKFPQDLFIDLLKYVY